jgi:3-oxoacyl-[acyl-carrier protein] reductase
MRLNGIRGLMDLGLAGRPALVAAASKGLGKACAAALAAEGARVAICAREEGPLDEARRELAAASGAEVMAIPADVATEEGATGFVRQASEALGGCQILVANSGGPPAGEVLSFGDDDLRAALDLNFLSTVRMIREAVPRMREGGYGRVVIISSSALKQPIEGLVLSTSARAAAAGWARNLADELAGEGITVNTVLPGRFETDRVRWLRERRAEAEGRDPGEVARAEAEAIPAGRIGDPAELGAVVAFLCSEKAGYVTGTFVSIDGGMYRGLF